MDTFFWTIGFLKVDFLNRQGIYFQAFSKWNSVNSMVCFTVVAWREQKSFLALFTF